MAIKLFQEVPEGYTLYLDKDKTKSIFGLDGVLCELSHTPYNSSSFRDCKKYLTKIYNPEFVKLRTSILAFENDSQYRICDLIYKNQMTSVEELINALTNNSESVELRDLNPEPEIFNFSENEVAVSEPVKSLFGELESSIFQPYEEDEEDEEDEKSLFEYDEEEEESTIPEMVPIERNENLVKLEQAVEKVEYEESPIYYKTEIIPPVISDNEEVIKILKDQNDQLNHLEDLVRMVMDSVSTPKGLTLTETTSDRVNRIQNYIVPEALKNYIKNGGVGIKYDSPLNYKGCQIDFGMEEFVDTLDLSFIHFLSTHYRWVIKEYFDNIVKGGK